MFYSHFLDPLSSFSVGYKSESNDAKDSKKKDLSQFFGMELSLEIKHSYLVPVR